MAGPTNGDVTLQTVKLPQHIAERVTALARAGDVAKAQGMLLGFGATVKDDTLRVAAIIEYMALHYMDAALQQQWSLLVFNEGTNVTPEDFKGMADEGFRRYKERVEATQKQAQSADFDDLVATFTGGDIGKTH